MKLLRKFGIGMEKEILARVNQLNSDILDGRIERDKYRNEIISIADEIGSPKSLKICGKRRTQLLAVLLTSVSSKVLEEDGELKKRIESSLYDITMYGKTVGPKLLRSRINASLCSLKLLVQIAKEHGGSFIGNQAVEEAKEIIEILNRRINLYDNYTTGMIKGMVVGGIALIPSYLLVTSTATDLIEVMFISVFISGIALSSYIARRIGYANRLERKMQDISSNITQLEFQMNEKNEEVNNS